MHWNDDKVWERYENPSELADIQLSTEHRKIRRQHDYANYTNGAQQQKTRGRPLCVLLKCAALSTGFSQRNVNNWAAHPSGW